MPKLVKQKVNVLVDGFSEVYRTFPYKGFTNSNGELTGVTYGFLLFLKSHYNKFGGKVRLTISVIVESYSKPNMESLADVCIVGFSDHGAVRGELQKKGIVVEPDAFVRVGSESEKQLTETRKVYGVNLSFPVFANWKRTVEIPGEILTDPLLDLTKDTL